MSTFRGDQDRELDDALDRDALREHISDIDIGFSDAERLYPTPRKPIAKNRSAIAKGADHDHRPHPATHLAAPGSG